MRLHLSATERAAGYSQGLIAFRPVAPRSWRSAARHELSLPPKLTYGEIKGFTLYATRTIVSGGGEELVDLAKTNLRDLESE